MYKFFISDDGAVETILKVRFTRLCLSLLCIVFQGIPFEAIVKKYPNPPTVKDIEAFQDKNSIFMIKVNLIIVKLHDYLLL